MGSEIKGRAGTGTPEDQQPIVLPQAFREMQAVAPAKDAAIWLRRHYASAVTVATTVHEGDFYGLAVSAFAYVSLEPLLVLMALGTESQTGERIRTSRIFGISLLSYSQQFLSDRFAGRAPLVDRRFEGVSYLTAVTGSPLLSECVAWLDCRLQARYEGGDHDIYIGEVVAVAEASGNAEDPLIYFNSRYRRLR